MVETVERDFPGGIRARVLAHRAPLHDFSQWEREPREWMAESLRPGMVVLDCGAEEGESSVLAAKRVGPSFVHILEAAYWYLPNIRAVWEANFPGEMPGGIWPGFVADSLRDADNVDSLTEWPAAACGELRLDGAFMVHHERPEVPTITIDEYCRRRGVTPDVILMDIEGCEHRALIGAEQTLRRGPRLLVSIHAPDTLRYYGTSEELILAWMAARGYGWRMISRDHELHLLFEPEVGR